MSQQDTYKTQLNPEMTESSELDNMKLDVYYRGTSFSTKASSLPFHIGRDPKTCHLTVENKTASRNHCSFILKNNQIGLEDKSTNGTSLKLGQANSVLICQDFMPLSGQGYIKAGEDIDLNDPDIIIFKVTR